MRQRRPNRVAGSVHDAFWTYCGESELRMQQCGACRHLSWPPSAICELCGSDQLEWELLSGHGRIVSWCTFEQRYYAELETPWDAILVELDEGPLFISNPSGFDTNEISYGMRVRVAFVDCEDDAGRFRLPEFKQA